MAAIPFFDLYQGSYCGAWGVDGACVLSSGRSARTYPRLDDCPGKVMVDDRTAVRVYSVCRSLAPATIAVHPSSCGFRGGVDRFSLTISVTPRTVPVMEHRRSVIVTAFSPNDAIINAHHRIGRYYTGDVEWTGEIRMVDPDKWELWFDVTHAIPTLEEDE